MPTYKGNRMTIDIGAHAAHPLTQPLSPASPTLLKTRSSKLRDEDMKRLSSDQKLRAFPGNLLPRLDTSMAKSRSTLPSPDELLGMPFSANMFVAHPIPESPVEEEKAAAAAEPADEEQEAFTPYHMDTAAPKVHELVKVQPGARGTVGRLTRQRSTGSASPRVDGQGGFLKRSISMLLRRSSSTSRPHSSEDSESPAASPPVSPTTDTYHGLGNVDLSAALSISQFTAGSTMGTLSTLIGNSMVHVKVVLDAQNAVVLVMPRTLVFAQARERILTKFFTAGFPLVALKRRRLVLRQPGGQMFVVADNRAWRGVMDAVGSTRALRKGEARRLVHLVDESAELAAEPVSVKCVDKLTLHLVDPSDALLAPTEEPATPCAASAGDFLNNSLPMLSPIAL
ncbi:hypothetical protein FBU59_003267 [Linderina macrospora]|uniref:Uncharacterized protein n=1 Tax=Linderina macrospora TaxID=4868 RepID=A0ACC1J906_9FUNG|nr:hypothetical protein FBU59_003267 [Linderina macrospora]